MRVHPITAGLGGLFVGLALGVSGGGWLATNAMDAAAPPPVVVTTESGADEYIQRMTDLLNPPQEDEPGWDAERHGNGTVGPEWDCTTMGDRICQGGTTLVGLP